MTGTIREDAVRNAARVIGAAGIAAGALAVLTSVHAHLVDAGADVVLIASLLMLAHTVFRLVDDPEPDTPAREEDRAPYDRPPRTHRGKNR